MSLFFGCKERKSKKSEDKFYTHTTSSWDAVRIPLIKPYELIRTNGSMEWTMNLNTIPGSVSNIKEVNVLKNVIVIHSGETYCNNEKVQEAWVLVMPDKNIEQCFESKQDFDKQLSSLQISNPKFYAADKIYDQFDKNKKIDWQVEIE